MEISLTELAALMAPKQEQSSILTGYVGQHVCVRSNGSGVWLGTVKAVAGADVILTDARRCWYWAGAATLSELATRGTSSPSACRWPVAVAEVAVTSVLEVIPTTEAARATYAAVAVWSQ